MKHWIVPAVLAIALIFTGVWGYQQYQLNQEYMRHMENIYQKSFYELVGNVGSVESGLAKLMVSGDRSQHAILLSEISRQAQAAQMDLGQLPVSHIVLDKTSKFLNQLADYAYFLNKKVAGGKIINNKEMENLMHLHENAVRLNEELTKLTAETLKENTGWGELMRSAKTSFYEVSDDIYSKQFVNIQKTGIEYPTLIYDGPFSEALDQKLGSLLEGSTVTEQQAMDIALNFIGPDRAVRIEKSSGSSNGILDTWGFQVWVKEEPENPFIYFRQQTGWQSCQCNRPAQG